MQLLQQCQVREEIFSLPNQQLHIVLSIWESENTSLVLLFSCVRTICVIFAIIREKSHRICAWAVIMQFWETWEKQKSIHMKTKWKKSNAENEWMNEWITKYIKSKTFVQTQINLFLMILQTFKLSILVMDWIQINIVPYILAKLKI